MGSKSLPTMLSQAYVAFTIEFDNEWERRLRKAGWAPRFLVSYVMWANLMRWVGEGPIAVADLEARAGVWNGPIHLGRMEEWWGYVSIEPDPKDARAKPPRADQIVRPSPAGELALRHWDGLDRWVDEAWLNRLGRRGTALRKALGAVERSLDLDLPDAMPVLGYADGYATPRPDDGPSSPASSTPQTIGAALARVLLAFTLAYEEKSELPLAMAACVLRVLSEEPLPAKEVPVRAGVRKEATDPALKFLAKGGYIETANAGAKMTVRLTADGTAARASYVGRIAAVERAWSKKIGGAKVEALREALEALYEDEDGTPRIAAGLATPEKGWRGTKPYAAQTDAFIAEPEVFLPHHPLLTHRGGWPDGA